MNQTNKKITTEEAGNRLIEGFECMDDSKLAGLESVERVQNVKSGLNTREAKRLEVKYGNNSPQAVKARAKVSYYNTAKVGLAEQVQMASAKPPRFEADSWRFQGRVVDTKNQGLSGLTVSLFDEKGEWIRALGQDCTDEKGFFTITYKQEKREKAALANASNQVLIPTVSDNSKTVLHQEKEPVFLKIGRIDSRLIILGEESCGTPPDSIDDNNIVKDEDVTDLTDLKDTWTVKGTVKEASTGKAITGMMVSLSDKELLFDDQLGTTTLDKAGSFVMKYRVKDFKELFDKKPDLYLKVIDEAGNIVYNSRKKVRCKEGKEERFDIRIRRKK